MKLAKPALAVALGAAATVWTIADARAAGFQLRENSAIGTGEMLGSLGWSCRSHVLYACPGIWGSALRWSCLVLSVHRYIPLAKGEQEMSQILV